MGASAEHDTHHIITYVNALGNLGHDAAALHLLKVIEGQLTRNAYVRSVAVYQLMRAAAAKPAIYRPILFQHMQHRNKVSSMLKHIVIEMGQKICISKQQIKVCGSQGSPKGIMQQREVELFCLPKDREGMTMRQMAESGDKIERASSSPTESVAIVYEP